MAAGLDVRWALADGKEASAIGPSPSSVFRETLNSHRRDTGAKKEFGTQSRKEMLDRRNRLAKRFGGNQEHDRFGQAPSMKKGCFIDGLLSLILTGGTLRRQSIEPVVPKGVIKTACVRHCKRFLAVFAIHEGQDSWRPAV